MHWDVTSIISTMSPSKLGYSRDVSQTGLSAFYKIPLAILVVKKPVPADPPVAAFSATPVSGTAPLTVLFTDESTNTPTSRVWDFGDGNSTWSTTETTFAHTYAAAGTYDVTLAVANSGGSDSEIKDDFITVSEPVAPPVAAFTNASVRAGNSPLTVSFTDQSTGEITGWLWDFGDGTTSTDTNPSHLFNLAGYYNVSLTVTGPGGSSTETKTNYVTARCNFAIGGIPVPQGGATLFANENNTIMVTLVKNTVGNSPAVPLFVNASDGWSTRVTVPAMNTTTGSIIVVGVDPTIRSPAGSTVKYTAILDPDNTVPETSETDNTKTSNKIVTYNGYKGVQYWNGKTPPQTYLTFDLHGNVIHSFGDSAYVSGKGSTWTSLTWTWTAADLPVPAGATVKSVRLYIPYCWDYEHEISGGTTTTSINGIMVAPLHKENDTSNFGSYAQYEYGLVTYNVTDQFLVNQQNTVVFTRSNSAGSLSPAGFTLAVVYEDPAETRKQIFINEGWDLLGAAQTSYGTTEEEATSYQDFSGLTIDMGSALKANLTTFVPWGSPQETGDPGEGNLFINGQLVGYNVWDYGGSGWGANGLSQVAVNTTNVLSYLKAGGTGNGIAIQSTAGASPCMVAERAFLVIEYPADVVAPVAAFSADPVSGNAPLTVLFTDTSTNDPTSRVWDFGDGNSTWSTTETTFAHTYALAGTYDVTLAVANSGGSDSEIKDDFITVSSSILTIPGQANQPTDPDHDGKYEDLSGSGDTDFPDVQLYFQNMDWIAANEPVDYFDYSNSGTIDFPDIQLLFAEV
jgi:PKD repeat protein